MALTFFKKKEKNFSGLAQQINPKIGIIAGGGSLPIALADYLEKKNQPFFVLALKGHADAKSFSSTVPLKVVRLGAIGKAFNLLRKNGVKKIVFIGSVKRPSFSEIRPDFKGLSLLAKLSLKALGDDGLLRFVIKEVEKNGFEVVGVHELMPNLLVPKGVLTHQKPNAKDLIDIERGFFVVKLLGKADVGQAVIVQQGLVLSLEGIEGTKALIERTKNLKRKGDGGVLVKAIKPQQEKRIDMPTIGPDTVKSIYDSGLKGIAVEAEKVLLAEADKTIELADKLNIFIVGVHNGSTDLKHATKTRRNIPKKYHKK